MNREPTTEETTLVHRVGIIGDVHTEHRALEAALTYLREVSRLDALLCTGDVVDGLDGGDAGRCCVLLQQEGVRTIRGNHDRWFFESDAARAAAANAGMHLAARAFLSSLPKTLTFDTPRGQLLLCHGLADDDMAGIYPGGDEETIRRTLKERRVYLWYRVVVAGHTHRRMVRTVGTVTIINAGTLQWGYEPCFCVADFDDGWVQFYNVEQATYEISEAERYELRAGAS
jgi:putative phosphoesterase